MSNTTATYNSAYGVQSAEQNTTGASNTAIGVAAMDRNTTGSNNAVLGAFAGRYIADGATYATLMNTTVLIGASAKPNADNESNQIVIGYNAVGAGSNTVQLGNTGVTLVNTSGAVSAKGSITSGQAGTDGSLAIYSEQGATDYTYSIVPNAAATQNVTLTLPVDDGTASQILITDGSGALSWTSAVSVREVADEFSATASQTSFTLTQTKSANSQVKMYVNGIRISNTAYSVTGTTLTYIPANNGSYNLSVSDRIQFDYFY